jgi:hypothetical protein
MAQYATVIREVLDPIVNTSGPQAALVSWYSFWRLLPTLADIRQQPWEQRLAFGQWQSVPCAVAAKPDASRSMMRVRYADRKDITEVVIKLVAVRVLARAIVDAGTPRTWESVRAALPNVDVLAVERAAEEEVASHRDKVLAKGAQAHPDRREAKRIKLRQPCPSAQQERGLPALPLPQSQVKRPTDASQPLAVWTKGPRGNVEARRWHTSYAPRSLVHFLSHSAKSRPICNMHFYGTMLAGVGLPEAKRTGKQFCTSCLAKLTQEERDFLASASV